MLFEFRENFSEALIEPECRMIAKGMVRALARAETLPTSPARGDEVFSRICTIPRHSSSAPPLSMRSRWAGVFTNRFDARDTRRQQTT